MSAKHYNKDMSFITIILAAGFGTRMKSALPKPLHLLGGKPLVMWVMEAAGAGDKILVTSKENRSAIEDALKSENIKIAVQDPPNGTGGGVMAAKSALTKENGVAIIAFADTPLVQADTYRQLAASLHDSDTGITCLGFHTDAPSGYGRMMLNEGGQLTKIIEEKDASPEEKKITFVNAGMMAVKLPLIFELLDSLKPNDKTGEIYLTDCIEAAQSRGLKVNVMAADKSEVMGINDRKDLALAEAAMQNRLRQAAMEGGATLIAPETVFLHHDTILEPDTIIEPHVIIGAGVQLGRGTVVKGFSHLEGVKTGINCTIGPYARVRPKTELGEGVKIGNFVEVKNTHLNDGAKAGHLSYLGDSEIGAKANIGAGTITCNYDGFNKHKTTIGEGAFIGSNATLIAPLAIGKRAIIGGGSTIAKNIGDDDLSIGRSEQKTITGGAVRLRRKKGKKND